MAEETRFEFGRNWRRFLSDLSDARIEEAERSLVSMLELERLDGLSFVDVGSGSGLFSLAARRLGARVHSFDYDPESVECTKAVRSRYCQQDPQQWTIDQGSVLDRDYIDGLGRFDIVYAWGVLHHTGSLWSALENAARLVADGGRLFVAIYNDMGVASTVWRGIKRTYCSLPGPLRPLVLYPAAVRLWGPRMIKDLLQLRPMATWNGYARNRGMSPWRDVVDWVGGYPYEVATTDRVCAYLGGQNFVLAKLVATTGHGNNQYVFSKSAPDDPKGSDPTFVTAA